MTPLQERRQNAHSAYRTLKLNHASLSPTEKEQHFDAIAQYADLSLKYVRNISFTRFKRAEKAIIKHKDVMIAVSYMIATGVDLPECRPEIAKCGHASFRYATEVIEARFKEGEEALLTAETSWYGEEYFKKLFNGRWLRVEIDPHIYWLDSYLKLLSTKISKEEMKELDTEEMINRILQLKSNNSWIQVNAMVVFSRLVRGDIVKRFDKKILSSFPNIGMMRQYLNLRPNGWPELEEKLLKSSDVCKINAYLEFTNKKRWRAAERIITQTPFSTLDYMKLLKKST